MTQKTILTSAIVLAGWIAQAFGADTPTLDEQLRGAGFGFGVGAIGTFGKRPIDTASIDSTSIVRVTEKSAVRVGAILEAHYLLGGLLDQKGNEGIRALANPGSTERGSDSPPIDPRFIRKDKANGPMAVVELGENVIRSFGIGWMWSWRRYRVEFDKPITDSTKMITALVPSGPAFSIGLAGIIEPKVKSLPSGFQKNKAAPAGITTVTLEEKERFGAAFVFSASF